MNYKEATYDQAKAVRVQSLTEDLEAMEQRYRSVIERLEKLEVQAGNAAKEINRLSDRVG